MIGPGTGLAPFRGFLQEIKHRRESVEAYHPKEAEVETQGETMLFFGCRYPDQDYIYKEELGHFLCRSFFFVSQSLSSSFLFLLSPALPLFLSPSHLLPLLLLLPPLLLLSLPSSLN